MVIDLRTISPFDWDAIAAAVKHTTASSSPTKIS
jgi:pyruvate/2-oxoglutarate/acetoin dehydrogenase E1 component